MYGIGKAQRPKAARSAALRLTHWLPILSQPEGGRGEKNVTVHTKVLEEARPSASHARSVG